MASFSFDAASVAPEPTTSSTSSSYDEPIPDGTYTAVIIESDRGAYNDASKGEKLTLKFEITDGSHAGRWVWANLNLWHVSDAARKFAERDLGSICRAVNVPGFSDTQELHNKPLLISTRQNGEWTNIKAYAPVSTMFDAAAAAPTAKKPWEQ